MHIYIYSDRIAEKPNKQMEIFYDTERFTSEFDGLLKSFTQKNILDFWNILPICFDKREYIPFAVHTGEKVQNFYIKHAIEILILLPGI